jgi:dihydroorotase
MVHIGGSYAPIEDILVQLRAGDIVTHAFTAWEPGIFDSAMHIIPAALEARARGVLFDVGHGRGSFAFARGEAALADGFRPDTISSDLHRFNVDGPVFDLVTTMSKYLHLGLPLDDVLAMATVAPSVALGRAGQMGTLAVGGPADIAVLRLEEGRFPFTDSFGTTIDGQQRLVPMATFKRGRRVDTA